MKTLSTFFLFISLTVQCLSQDVNGWEFLNWKMNKDSVEKTLIANKNLLSPPDALDANFNYQNMNVWLVYDSLNRLIKVHQRKTFSVNKAKEAENFYTDFKSLLIKKYGKPEQFKKDKKHCVVSMTWHLKFTKIAFEYDYKYKVIDEFGADSYWIDVTFEPVKTV